VTTHADPQQPLQTAQITVQQSQYWAALIADIVNRLEFLGQMRPGLAEAAQVVREEYGE
jgi:hypothetical protein